MKINLPYKVRATLYIVTGVLNIAMLYFVAENAVGQNELIAWASLNTFIAALAGYNVTPDEV